MDKQSPNVYTLDSMDRELWLLEILHIHCMHHSSYLQIATSHSYTMRAHAMQPHNTAPDKLTPK